MSGDTTRVHSRSGNKPLTNHTITEFRNYARNLGSEFGQLDYHYFILQLLYLVEYADYNSQAKLGPGYTDSTHTSPITSGGCDYLGMKSGSVDNTGTTSVIYRGIEDIFGNVWQFVDGINIKDNQAYICYDRSQYEVDKFDGCYQALSYVNANTNGFISKLGYDINHPLVAFPIEVSGYGNSHITDHYWQNSGSRIAFIGGNYTHANSSNGLFFPNCSEYSYFVHISTSTRLLKMD